MNLPLYGIIAINNYIKDIVNLEDANASSKFPAIVFVHEYGDKKDILFRTSTDSLYDLGKGWKLSKITITRNSEPYIGNNYVAYILDPNGESVEIDEVVDAAWQNDVKMIKKSLQWIVVHVPSYSSAFTLERIEKLNRLCMLASFNCEELDCTDEIKEFVKSYRTHYKEIFDNHMVYAHLNEYEYSSLASLGYAAVNFLTGEI